MNVKGETQCDTNTGRYDGDVIDSDWIVILQHTSASFNWNLTWASYRDGFGSLDSNYWLGLEQVHQMTSGATYHIRIELQQQTTGKWFFTEYTKFVVGNETDTNYVLSIDGLVICQKL